LKLGMNNEDVQRLNRCLVIQLLLEKNPISRVELAKRTGLKKATITNIINEFIEMGIIEEKGQMVGEYGRKTDVIKLHVEKGRIISLRITRKYFEIELIDLNGYCLHSYKEPISTFDAISKTLDTLIESLKNVITDVGAKYILGISVAVPGPFIQGNKNLTLVSGFEQLKLIDIKKEIEEKIEKEFDIHVFVEHDAKLAAFAEAKHWSKVKKNVGILVEILSTGQGVGAGIIIDGKILKGKLGTAGEIGYMGINFNGPVAESGMRGTFEYYSSSESIKRYVLDRLNEFPETTLSEESTLDDIIEEYKKGNPLARWAVEKTAWHLGYGIASLALILNPEVIILGADYPRLPDFLDMVRDTVKQLVYKEIYDALTIDFSQVEGDATLMGGYYLVLDCLLHSQLILDRIKRVVSPD